MYDKDYSLSEHEHTHTHTHILRTLKQFAYIYIYIYMYVSVYIYIYTHTCIYRTHTHRDRIYTRIHRTLTQGARDDEEGLITRIQLQGPSRGLRPSVRVSGQRLCTAQVVVGHSVDAVESSPSQEEHWVCDLVRKINGMSAHFTVTLLYGSGACKVRGSYVCMYVCMYVCKVRGSVRVRCEFVGDVCDSDVFSLE
jgi:hypothetical protein